MVRVKLQACNGLRVRIRLMGLGDLGEDQEAECRTCGSLFSSSGDKRRRARIEACGHQKCLQCLEQWFEAHQECEECLEERALEEVEGDEEQQGLFDIEEVPDFDFDWGNWEENGGEEEEEEEPEIIDLTGDDHLEVSELEEENREVVERPRKPRKVRCVEGAKRPVLLIPQRRSLRNRQRQLKKLVNQRTLVVQVERLPEKLAVAKKFKVGPGNRVNGVELNKGGIAITDCDDQPKASRTRGKKRKLNSGRISESGTENQCQYCSKVYTTRRRLGLHMSKKHGDKRPYPCTVCKWPFQKSSLLAAHMLIHTNQRPFSCEVCERAFRRNHHLTNHLLKIHGIEMKERKRVKTFQAKEVKGKPERIQFSCMHCTKAFKKKYLLALHLIQKHRKKRPFHCESCGWSFTRKSKFLLHKRTHSSDQPHKCPQCKISFKWKPSLEMHVEIMHCKRPKEFEAPFPENKPRQRQTAKLQAKLEKREELAKHLKKKIGSQRPYRDQCDKSFCKKRRLVTHRKTHDKENAPQKNVPKEKPHGCRICHVSYNKLFNLERHLDKVHGVKIILPRKEEEPRRPRRGKKINDGKEYCPECQSLFDDDVQEDCDKVAYSKCGHLCCLNCVIRFEFLGCGQCTTAACTTKQPVEENVTPRTTESRIRSRSSSRSRNRSVSLSQEEEEEEMTTPKKKVKRLNAQIQDDTKQATKSVKGGKTLDRKVSGILAAETPFPCHNCQGTFSTREELKQHQLSHAKEDKRFQCKHCKETFSQTYNVNRHVQRKHPELSQLQL